MYYFDLSHQFLIICSETLEALIILQNGKDYCKEQLVTGSDSSSKHLTLIGEVKSCASMSVINVLLHLLFNCSNFSNRHAGAPAVFN